MTYAEVWDALWTMNPLETAVLLSIILVSAVLLSLCVVLLIDVQMGFEEEDELWEN